MKIKIIIVGFSALIMNFVSLFILFHYQNDPLIFGFNPNVVKSLSCLFTSFLYALFYNMDDKTNKWNLYAAICWFINSLIAFI